MQLLVCYGWCLTCWHVVIVFCVVSWLLACFYAFAIAFWVVSIACCSGVLVVSLLLACCCCVLSGFSVVSMLLMCSGWLHIVCILQHYMQLLGCSEKAIVSLNGTFTPKITI